MKKIKKAGYEKMAEEANAQIEQRKKEKSKPKRNNTKSEILVENRLLAKKKEYEAKKKALADELETRKKQQLTFRPSITRKRLTRSQDLENDLLYPDVFSRLFQKAEDDKPKKEAELEKKHREVHPFKPKIKKLSQSRNESSESVRTRLFKSLLIRKRQIEVRNLLGSAASEQLRLENDDPLLQAPTSRFTEKGSRNVQEHQASNDGQGRSDGHRTQTESHF